MICSRNLNSIDLRRPLISTFQHGFGASLTSARHSSLSAIHRGLRHSDKAQYGEQSYSPSTRQRNSSSSEGFTRRISVRDRDDRSGSGRSGPRDAFAEKFNTRAGEGPSSYRQQGKLKKKLAKKEKDREEDEESGRRTRRKRFVQPDTDFGKKSLVYRLKHGDLKEKAAALQIQEPVRPIPFRSIRRDARSNDRPDWKPFDERDNGVYRRANDESKVSGTKATDNFRRNDERHSLRDGNGGGRFQRENDTSRFRGDDDRAEGGDRSRFRRNDDRHSLRDDNSEGRYQRKNDTSRFRGDGERHSLRDGNGEGRYQRDGASRFRSDDDRAEGGDRSRLRRNDEKHSLRDGIGEGRYQRDGASRFRGDNGKTDGGDWNRIHNSFANNIGGEVISRAPRKEMQSMVVKYTTAASQFLYGRSVVKAALEQGRRKFYNLYIYGGEHRKDSKDESLVTRLAMKHSVPVTIVPNEQQRLMDKMSMGRPHNGYVLETSPLPQLPVISLDKLEETPERLGFHVKIGHQSKEDEAINGNDTFVRRSSDVTPKPFVLLMNEIVDPGNLGGIIRTASYLGADAVGITSRGSSTLSPVVLKAAAGAMEEVSLFTVDDPVRFLQESRKAGWKTYAAVAPPDRKLVRKHGDKFLSTEDIEATDPLSRDPCILVMGNEGYGLAKEMKMASDYELSVPRFMQGSSVDSLNVSVAAGLLCHSFVRRKPIEGKSAPGVEKEASSSEEVSDEVSEIEEQAIEEDAAHQQQSSTEEVEDDKIF